MRMVSAYSIIANGGKQIKPTLIDRIQDRYGKTIFKHDERGCDGCNASDWQNQAEPELVDNREQVLDPMTAYQITSMMEGVVQRGTGASKVELGQPSRRQDRHHQRREGRLVHRLHAGPRRRPLYRLRHAAPLGQRRAPAAGLPRRSSTNSCRLALKDTPRRRFQVPRRHEADRHQPQDRHARRMQAIRAPSSRPSSRAPARPTAIRSSAWAHDGAERDPARRCRRRPTRPSRRAAAASTERYPQ